eukprot:1025780-Amphidinium_carterae.1
MVDVRRFVDFVESLALMPQALTEGGAGGGSLATVGRGTASEAGISIVCSGQGVAEAGAGERRSAISDTMTMTTIKDATIPSKGEARLLPHTAFELGGGAFGVVHEARRVDQRLPEEDVGGVDIDTPHREPHTDSSCRVAPHSDPSCTLAVKLAGSIGAEGYTDVDLKLAAMAVEAAAAAEARRITSNKEGKVFLPVLHAVGEVASVGGISVSSVGAIVMEMADGTLKQRRPLAGEALSRVAWALATTLSRLNLAGFIHGDVKPDNVLWKKMPRHDGVTDGWPLLTDFGASQSFRSFRPGEALSPSEGIRTSAWTPEYAAPE